MNEYQYSATGFGGQEQQLAPQGFFGSLIGGPVGGLVGRGIGGLLGNARLGSQIGQVAGGIGGAFLPFGADPYMAAYAQPQQQFAPQGWIGNAISTFGRPLGTAIGGAFGNPQLGGTIGGIAGQIGRLLPFEADPYALAYAQQQAQLAQLAQQQQQLAPQGWFGNALGALGRPIGSAIGGAFGNAQLGGTIGGLAGQLGRMLPFEADPYAAYAQQQAQQAQLAAQQQQLAPQGWFGNALGALGRPIGSAIGGAFGNAQLGGTIGGLAGQLGRMLPFEADPYAAYAQQAQLAQMAQQSQPQGFIGMGGSSQPTIH